MFSSLKRWLGIEPLKPTVGFRPHRTVELAEPYDAAYDRVFAAMDAVLGANVRDADRATGIIDADFGTIGSERIRATVERAGETLSRVHVEARYPATATPPVRSNAVDALANILIFRQPHFVARIRLRDTGEGGRSTPVYLKNYRPDIRDPGGQEWLYGAHFFHDDGELAPGETRDLRVTIRNVPEEFMKQVSVGSKLVFVEGPRPVADGEILEILARTTP